CSTSEQFELDLVNAFTFSPDANDAFIRRDVNPRGARFQTPGFPLNVDLEDRPEIDRSERAESLGERGVDDQGGIRGGVGDEGLPLVARHRIAGASRHLDGLNDGLAIISRAQADVGIVQPPVARVEIGAVQGLTARRTKLPPPARSAQLDRLLGIDPELYFDFSARRHFFRFSLSDLSISLPGA